ncbi:MAG: hypothetical protein AB7K86_03375 [Rhodospirillales bacterium]
MWRWLRRLAGAGPSPQHQAAETGDVPAGADRQRALDALAAQAIAAASAAVAHRKPAIAEFFSYGATSIHGRYLTPWFLFRTDAELAAARANGLAAEIERRVRDELLARGWPAGEMPACAANFTTQEDIQRRAGGDYWKYFR